MLITVARGGDGHANNRAVFRVWYLSAYVEINYVGTCVVCALCDAIPEGAGSSFRGNK